MEILYAFLGGLVLTALVAFLIARSVVKSRVARTAETVRLQDESVFNVEKTRLESDLGHANDQVRELLANLEKAKAETLKQVQAARDEAARANAEVIAARDKAHDEAMEALQKRFDETIGKVSAQMKADTSRMLQDRQKEFSELSNQSIEQIVKPLKDNISELKKTMAEGTKEQIDLRGEMRQQVQHLISSSDAARKSADELTAAFKHGSKMQGDWGETILEELLASQGLTKGVHFSSQDSIRDAKGELVKSDGDALLRPDIILHLDERREVIIDSKVSLTAYVDYVNAENESDRQKYLKLHVESLKKHVKELSRKDYSQYIQAPKVTAGYVIMFVPHAGALWTALNAEPDLWRKAADMNVYIADEQSLYGALKIVSLTWTQVLQAQSHEKVYELANEMIERVGMFMEKYESVGKALKRATDEYDDGLKKLSPQGQSIINTSGKLIRLGARNSDKHPVKALLDVDEIPAIPSETTSNQ